MINRNIIEKWKNAYLVSNDERGRQVKYTAAWKASRKLDIILLVCLFGLAFIFPQELHTILTIAIIVIIKTSLEIYYRFLCSKDDVL